MNIKSLQRRTIARDILIHMKIHGRLSTQNMGGNVLAVVKILEQSGVVAMAENNLDLVIIDQKRAGFLLNE